MPTLEEKRATIAAARQMFAQIAEEELSGTREYVENVRTLYARPAAEPVETPEQSAAIVAAARSKK
jgi:hypothetical protein